MNIVLISSSNEYFLAVTGAVPNDTKVKIVNQEQKLDEKFKPDILLIDLSLELDFIKSELKKFAAPAIALVQFESTSKLAELFLSGVKSMVFLESLRNGLHGSIIAVMEKNVSISPSVAGWMLKLCESKNFLDKHQQEILRLVEKGKSIIDISSDTNMSRAFIIAKLWSACSIENSN